MLRRHKRIVIALVVLVFVADVAVVYALLSARPSQRAGDFFIPFYATHALVVDGRDPYSEAVTRDIQIALRGAPFPPDVEDRLSFNYPLYTSLYMLPLLPLDYSLAEAIWNVLNQFGMFALIWVLLRLVGWQAKNMIQRQIPYLFGFLCYPFIYTIAYGQYTIISLLFAASGALLFRSQRYGLGGVLIGLAMFKPQIGLLLVVCLCAWFLFGWRERWRGVAAIGGVGLVLLVAPMLWQPDWLWRWQAQAAYRRIHPGMYSFGEDAFFLSGIGRDAAMLIADGLAVVLVAFLLWLWWRARTDPARFGHLVCLTALLTLVVIPQWGYCNDILFYPAALLLFNWLRPRVPARLLTLLMLFGALVLFAPLLLNPTIIQAGIVVIALAWLTFAVWTAQPFARLRWSGVQL